MSGAPVSGQPVSAAPWEGSSYPGPPPVPRQRAAGPAGPPQVAPRAAPPYPAPPSARPPFAPPGFAPPGFAPPPFASPPFAQAPFAPPGFGGPPFAPPGPGYAPPYPPAYPPAAGWPPVAGWPQPPARSRPGSRLAAVVLAVVAAAVALVATGAIVVTVRDAPEAAVADGVATDLRHPWTAAQAALRGQAAALLRGDEAGWLAAVDPQQPGLRSRYRELYQRLRALDVTAFTYRVTSEPPAGDVTDLDLELDVTYCFSRDVCPPHRDGHRGAPRIRQALALRPVGGRYVIAAQLRPEHTDDLQPVPWEGALRFDRGDRVTVAAPPAEAGRLAEVLAVAERAARVNDRFAAMVGNPQRRYRVYLADRDAWRRWYGGQRTDMVIAYAVPLNTAGTDVVLNMDALTDPDDLASTVQHEMGHVVTLGGVDDTGADGEDESAWLTEGVAEYIGYWPRHAVDSPRRSGVRAALRGGQAPTSIAQTGYDQDSARAGDRFYGFGHFAADCLAQTYGEDRLFTFVRLRLRQGESDDAASREAFGRPFAVVDRGCVAWIRQHA